MFGFDERFAMFDITPVENQFILEFLPGAKGDYIKVYLYGLMRCYHPEADMSMTRMSRELNMTEEEICAAFRYWERRGAVRRISDKPPRWQFVNIKQKSLTGAEDADPEYEEFSRAVYDAFDNVRRLHGSELSTCFEWHEDLKLPTEVIVMLLNHMAAVKGRNFKINDAQKAAMRMADENIRTVDAAEMFFSRDEKIYAGAKKVLKLLGKSYQPSEAQTEMYRKWIYDWHFTPAAIEEAVKLTAKGDPSMGYLDGILKGLRKENSNEIEVDSDQVAEALRTVIKELGRDEVNPRNLELYDRMKALYPQQVILTAAAECRHSGKSIEDLLKLLESWDMKGLKTENQVNDYIQAFRQQTELIRELKTLWGTEGIRIGETDRKLVQKWQKELGFGKKMILAAAPAASEAKMPMNYLDRILVHYRELGITTPEEAEAERRKPRTEQTNKGANGKTVLAQQYEQRDYSEVQDQMMEQQKKEMEAFLRSRNGGESDA